MERSPQGRWSISESLNSRQVGVWKYGNTWCRWVLHSFGYSDFHRLWCSWWEVTAVLPSTGILETLAQHDEASAKISSPLVWWCLRLDHLLITMRQMRRFHRHWFDDIRVSERSHGVPSWKRFAQKFGLWILFREESLMTYVIIDGISLRTLQWRLWSFSFVTFCHVCWKNKGYELGSFSRLRMPDAFSFFCMSTEFHQPHVFETNRKQTTCTNQFSMCLSRRQF